MALQHSARIYLTLSTVFVVSLLLIWGFALPAAAQTTTQISVPASADARVLEGSPGLNYGSSTKLDVDSPDEQSFIRFEVVGITGPVESALLRVFARNGSGDGPAIYPTASEWSESTITWNNRPAATGNALADVGVVSRNAWIEYDLSGHVTADGTYNFVFLPDSTNGVRYNSREAVSPPELVVVFAEGPINQPPNAIDDVASTDEDAAVSILATANDDDPDGILDQASTNTICAGCSNPNNGILINNQDGSFLYTPDPDFYGQDSFVYQVCDTVGDCATATVAITITAAPDAPLASSDSASTIGTQPVTLDVAANDTDPDGDLDPTTTNTTCPTGCANPTNGTLTNHTNGTFTYTANQGFAGTDTFTYQICDTLGACNTATATITVVANTPPQTTNDTASTIETQPVTLDVAANDTDPDGTLDPTTTNTTCPTGCANPTNGTLTNHTNGTFTYTANQGFTGTDTFTYQICDTLGACNTATATITVVANTPPQTTNDTASTIETQPVTLDVAANDTDPDGDLDPTTTNTTCPTGCANPTNGTLTNHTNGTFTYTANQGFAGTDTFTYQICDTLGACNTATATITVVANTPPQTTNDTASTIETQPVTLDVAANDTDPDGTLDPTTTNTTCPTGCANPTNGTLTNHTNGTFTYTANQGFTGTDTFTYQICDTLGACNTATATITVVANTPPQTTNDTASTIETQPVTLDVAANDTDPDGTLDPTTTNTTCPTGCANPTNGTLTNHTNGTFTYTANQGFTGTDTFTYQICDTLGACNTATATITVVANTPPQTTNDTASTIETQPVTLDVAANDTDPDGTLDPTTTNTTCTPGCANPTNGTLTNHTNGTFTYTANQGFTGTDTFTYQICDTLGACNTATATITVVANTPPQTTNDTASTIETQPVTLDVAANDTDPDGTLDPTTTNTTCPTGCANPTNGTLTNHTNGTFTYTANQGFTGTDTFTYQICDTLGACNTATATITVDAIPTASTLTFTPTADAKVLEGTPSINYGSRSKIGADIPDEQSFLRFAVSGIPGNVQSATLRLFVTNGSSNGPSLYATDNSWTEHLVTWNNRPSPTSGAVADIGSVLSGTWIEYDLTGHIGANGTYNLAMLPDSSNGVGFYAREGDFPPELVLVFGGSPTNSPPIAQDDNVTTTENVAVTIFASGNDSDPDGALDLTSLNTICTGCNGPAHGTLVNNGDGSFSYTPVNGYTGGDGFVYEICDTLGLCDTATVTISVNPPGTESAVFVGAGDIATCSSNADEATAQLLDNIAGTVFTIGDNAYPNGTASDYSNCYDPTWGRHKARTYPVIGDNEYNSSSTAAPYFNYYGAVAGDPDKGYYSYDVGTWHIIALNSNCSKVGGCGPNSAQGQWLQADLAANPNACILALHHDPLFSSKGGDADMSDFWDPLYAAGADVVLSGHRHNYERFSQQTPGGSADPGRGIRQFVVGTGGTSLSSFNGTAANSEVREDSTHGVLKLTLHPTSYDWEFIPVAGESFTDSGTTSCVNP